MPSLLGALREWIDRASKEAPAGDQRGDTAKPMLARVAQALIDGASTGTVADDPSDTAVPNLALGFREWIDRAAGVRDLTAQLDRGPSFRILWSRSGRLIPPFVSKLTRRNRTAQHLWLSPRPVRLFHLGA
jgi:hypothetical protein